MNLIGHSETNAAEDTGKFHVTFDHNWWSSGCVERMPRVRFGQVHVLNNYINASGNNYCVRAGIASQLLVEDNYYENIHTPYEKYLENGGTGLIDAVGNLTVNCANVQSFNDIVFSPPYPYILESPQSAKADVLSSAGAGGPLFP